MRPAIVAELLVVAILASGMGPLPTLAAPSCTTSVGDGRPTLKTIVMDGSFDDWASVTADADNIACDGYAGGPPDLDTPKNHSFDLVGLAWTWDEDYFYGDVSRAGDSNAFDKFVMYVDADDDGKMEAGEPVMAIHWKGNSRDVELAVGTYAPSVMGGDSMTDASGKVDGYTLPGDVSGLSSSTPHHWGSLDGSQMEWRINWTNPPTDPVEPGLGIPSGSPFRWHMESSNKEPDAANFPASVEDNMGGPGGYVGTARFAGVNATPDATLQVNGGETIVLAHTIANAGNDDDVIDVSVGTTAFSSSHGTPSVLGVHRDSNGNGAYDAEDALATDTDGDGIVDVGTLAPSASALVFIRATMPSPLATGDAATITMTARSSYVAPGDTAPRASSSATDTLLAKVANVSVSKTVDDATPPLGATIVYTVTATDNGPSAATDLVVSDILPTGVDYLGHTGDGTYDRTTGAWEIDLLAPGAAATVRITARVGSGALPSATNAAVRVSLNEIDDDGTDDRASVAIAPTHAPIAYADGYSLDENSTLIASAPGVLSNDTDLGPETLTAVLASGPSHGTLTLRADGGFTYVPTTHFYGTDSFSYRAYDGVLHSAAMTVTLTVTRRDLPPVAMNDAFTAIRGTPVSIGAPGVLGNDIDIDGNPLSAFLAEGVSHGTLALRADGSFDYAPTDGFEGTDAFTYRAGDGVLFSSTATVTIDVGHLHIEPIARPDSYAVAQDTTLSVADIGVMANDEEPDGDVIWPVVDATTTHGVLAMRAGGGFTYVPEPGFVGTDSFLYHVTDGVLDSATTSVTITVTGVNRAPTTAEDSYTVAQDGTLTVTPPGVLGNDTDPDGNPLTASISSGPSHGSLSLSADGGFTYAPNAGYAGNDSFTYEANDGRLDSARTTVTLTVTAAPPNHAPTATPDSYVIAENTTLTIAAPGVLANDHDEDGDALTAVLASGPSHGALTLRADGGFTYEPDRFFSGADSFSYRSADGRSASSPVFVQLTVSPGPDVPVALDDDYSAVAGTTLTIAAPGVLANDHDPDGEPVTAIPRSGVSHGTLTVAFDGSFVYVPDAGFSGVEYFTYVATDGGNESAPATVAISVLAGGARGAYTPLEPSLDFAGVSGCTPDRNVKLRLHAHNTDRVMISNDPSFAGAVWEPYSFGFDPEYRDWTLADADGTQTVYVKYAQSTAADFPSLVSTASILLDRAGRCADAVSQEPTDRCAVDFAAMEIHPHIVNPDGSERHEGEPLVRVARTAPGTLRYAFDDSGSDLDYDDAVLDVRVSGRKAYITATMVRAMYHHGIELHVHARGKIVDDLLLWKDSAAAVGKTHVFDLDASLARCRAGQAKSLKPGDLIKGDGSAVYFLGNDGRRHVFTSRQIYDTWYTDFSKVHRLSNEELATLPLGANVTAKPGKRLVRFLSDPKVYVVDLGGVLRWVPDERTATTLYGQHWQTSLVLLHDSVFTDYVEGSSLAGPEKFPRESVIARTTTIPF